MQSVVQNLVGEGGVSYTNAREEKVQKCHSGLCPSEKNFLNGVLACSITKIPLGTYNKCILQSFSMKAIQKLLATQK
jgi:hypothetical protein